MFGRFLQFYVRRLRVPLVGRCQVVLGDRPGPAGLRSRAMQALSPVPRPRPVTPGLFTPGPAPRRTGNRPKSRILEIPEKNYK